MSTASKLFFLFLPNFSIDLDLLGADDDSVASVPRRGDDVGPELAQRGDGDRERMFLELAPVRLPWPARW